MSADGGIYEALRSRVQYPFDINYFYNFLGFSQKVRCREHIEKKLSSSDYTVAFRKLSRRDSATVLLSKQAFIRLANKHRPDDEEWHGYLLAWKEEDFRARLLRFESFEQVYGTLHYLGTFKVKGRYHKYHLDTVNIAKELDLHPVDVFRLCFDLFECRYSHIRPDISYRGGKATPSYSFVSYFSAERAVIVEFIDLLIERFEFSGIKLRVAILYKRIIEELLSRQAALDKKANRPPDRHEHNRREKEKRERQERKEYDRLNNLRFAPKCTLTEDEKAELKTLYWAAAALCHPDKQPDRHKELGHQWFVKLNEANRQRDLARVRLLHQEITVQFSL